MIFFKCTDLTPVVIDRIQTRTESQIQTIPHIFITVHTHWVNCMYYNLFEDNEDVEKHQKPFYSLQHGNTTFTTNGNWNKKRKENY